MMTLLLSAFDIVNPRPPYPLAWDALQDANDHPIWAAAVEGRARYVVSDNTSDYPPRLSDGRCIYSRQRGEGALYPGPYVLPGQSAKATAECRYRERRNAKFLDHPHQCDQPRLDILDEGRIPKVSLGGRIDNPARTRRQVSGNDEHLAGSYRATIALKPITPVVLRKRSLELQCEAPTHHANTVDGIDQCLHISGRQIALCQFDHILKSTN
jgi:hypothetical protein